MKKKQKSYIKASIVIAVAIAFMLPGTPVLSEGNPIVLENDYLVIVENSSAWPGTVGHVVNITGIYAEEIFAYIIRIQYQTQGIGDTNVTDVNLDGCVGENPYYFNCQVEASANYVFIDATLVYTIDWLPGNGIPAGEGKLLNIVVDIDEGASPQTVEIIESVFGHCGYSTLSGSVIPEFIQGHLEILREPNPPNTPDQPDGPTSGLVGIEYTYTTNPVSGGGGGRKYYKWNFTDGETDWMQYDPGEDPYASHIWTVPGTYEVKVKAKNQYGDESDWSEPLEVTITDALPEFEIEITGGFNLIITVKNIGEAVATNCVLDATIDGGLFFINREFNCAIGDIDPGNSRDVPLAPVGIGLGILTEIPTIAVNATCAEGAFAEETTTAKILLILVLLQ